MNNTEYLSKLKDYRVWFNYARNQKLVADKILYNCILNSDLISEISSTTDYSDYVVLWSNAHYHYGIAIENGLKALIIKYYPDLIEFEIRGNDVVVLKSIGGKSGKTHNLYELAKQSGILNNEVELYRHKSDYEALVRVLSHLSHMIKWGARYPIPNNSSMIYKFDNAVPSALAYGFHILDVIEPIFKYFEKENTLLNNHEILCSATI